MLGLAASIVAALGPVREAVSVAPTTAIQRTSVERRAQTRSRSGAIVALPLLVLGSLLLAFETRSLLVAFMGIFCFLAAGALATPFATSWLILKTEPVARRFFGLSSVLALRNVNTHMSRIAVATAALGIAVATVVGVGLMIESFRSSLIDWLGTTLTADIYLAVDDTPAMSAETQIELLTGISGIAGVSRTSVLRVPTEYGTLSVRAIEAGSNGWGLDIVDGDSDSAFAQLESDGAIILSEPLAYRRNLTRGNVIELPTQEGLVEFEVAGVYRDYNASAGAVVLGMPTFRRHWQSSNVTGLGVTVSPGADASVVARRIAEVLPLPAGARVRTTEAIEDLSLRVFDRTFQITEVLRVLAAIVAFLGILSALLAIQLERAREFAVLRSIGFSPRDLFTLILTETGVLGLAAGILAIPIGCVLAALLVYVINRRSFGWTMDMVIVPEPLVFGLLLAVSAAILAGLLPSAKAAHGSLTVALRDE